MTNFIIPIKHDYSLPKMSKNVKSFFKTDSKYATIWRPEHESYFGKNAAVIEKQIIRDALSHINSEDLTILDVGGGMGRLIGRLLNKKPTNLVLLDISPHMLNLAKESVNRRQQETVSLILADAENMPFRHGQFDIIICLGLLMHLSNPQKVFHNFEKILKDDGFLISNNVNNTLWGHLLALGLRDGILAASKKYHGGIWAVLKKYLTTRRIGSNISKTYSLRECEDFHGLSGLQILEMHQYGNSFFPWVFLMIGAKRARN